MLKKIVNLLYLSGMFFYTSTLLGEIDITDILCNQDLQILDAYENVALIIPETINALVSVNAKENSDLYEIKSAIQQGLHLAPYDKVLEAVNQALSEFKDTNDPNYINLLEYKTMLENKDITVYKKDVIPNRNRKKPKKFCRVCVRTLRARCADIYNLTAGTISGSSTRCNFANGCTENCNPNKVLCVTTSESICGNLNVSGNSTFNNVTVNSIQGSVATCPTSCDPNKLLCVTSSADVCANLNVGGNIIAIQSISSGADLNIANNILAGNNITANNDIIAKNNVIANNIIFDSNLNVQGACEALTKLIRATIGFSASTITLDSANPGTVVDVKDTLPTASITAPSPSACLSIGSVSASGFSSGIAFVTAAGLAYDIDVDFKVPIIFSPDYVSLPSILLTLKNANQVINGATKIVDDNTSTILQLAISDVTENSAIVNLIFHVTAQGIGGTPYQDALNNAGIAINNIFNPAVNKLSFSILADGVSA